MKTPKALTETFSQKEDRALPNQNILLLIQDILKCPHPSNAMATLEHTTWLYAVIRSTKKAFDKTTPDLLLKEIPKETPDGLRIEVGRNMLSSLMTKTKELAHSYIIKESLSEELGISRDLSVPPDERKQMREKLEQSTERAIALIHSTMEERSLRKSTQHHYPSGALIQSDVDHMIISRLETLFNQKEEFYFSPDLKQSLEHEITTKNTSLTPGDHRKNALTAFKSELSVECLTSIEQYEEERNLVRLEKLCLLSQRPKEPKPLSVQMSLGL